MPFSVGPTELILVLVIALLVLGPKRCPRPGARRQGHARVQGVAERQSRTDDETRTTTRPSARAPTHPPHRDRYMVVSATPTTAETTSSADPARDARPDGRHARREAPNDCVGVLGTRDGQAQLLVEAENTPPQPSRPRSRRGAARVTTASTRTTSRSARSTTAHAHGAGPVADRHQSCLLSRSALLIVGSPEMNPTCARPDRGGWDVTQAPTRSTDEDGTVVVCTRARRRTASTIASAPTAGCRSCCRPRSPRRRRRSRRRRARAQDPPAVREGPLVTVAAARHQAEAELLQGMLLEEASRRSWRRSGGFDVPDFLASARATCSCRSRGSPPRARRSALRRRRSGAPTPCRGCARSPPCSPSSSSPRWQPGDRRDRVMIWIATSPGGPRPRRLRRAFVVDDSTKWDRLRDVRRRRPLVFLINSSSASAHGRRGARPRGRRARVPRRARPLARRGQRLRRTREPAEVRAPGLLGLARGRAARKARSSARAGSGARASSSTPRRPPRWRAGRRRYRRGSSASRRVGGKLGAGRSRMRQHDGGADVARLAEKNCAAPRAPGT